MADRQRKGDWRPPNTNSKSKRRWDLRYSLTYSKESSSFLHWLNEFKQQLVLYFSPTQACSAKSLERLRSQQEGLRSLKPQVVYLKDLARGLVQDSPQTPGGSTEGAERLQMQAEETEKEYDDVTNKVRAAAVEV